MNQPVVRQAGSLCRQHSSLGFQIPIIFLTEETDRGDETVEKAPEIDCLPVVLVQSDEGLGARVSQQVVSVALILSTVPPAKVVNEETAVV